MKKKYLALMLLFMVILIGCSRKPFETSADKTASSSADVLPGTEDTAQNIGDADQIEQDINEEELQNLDKDLDQITW